ncbi:MAG: cation:proton antiporter, partial [Cytophagaceae bacterium]
LFQVLLCSLILTIIVKAFIQLPWLVASVVGFSLSLSSTAFALQTLEERNEFKTDHGQAAFTILLTQDLLAIPVLAIVPMIWPKGGVESSGPLWLFPFVLVGLYVLSRFFIRPLFRHLAETHSREIFTVSALFIVLGVSAVMINIGLSAALGAFIAGVFLAENEYRHELEANIEPFRGLLMGLFFISVGMSVSIDLFLSRPLELLGTTLAYFLLKWALITFVGRREGMGKSGASRMGFFIAQGGEFAFVIFGLLAERKLMLDFHMDFLGAMITLSMLMGPFLEKILEARKKIFVSGVANEPHYDVIKDEHPEIIIGGFGRFGQMFGRVFRAQGIPFVAIDHDAGQIDLLRRFGNKVYFGDVSRLDLLRSAGADKAKYLVLAIDDVDVSIKTAQLVRQYFPHLKIFARARNRGHAFDLFEEGVTHIKRETFDSSVNFVGDLLVDMGLEKERAHNIIEHFRRHDEAMMREQAKVRKDEQMFISVSKQGAAQLENVLKDESNKSYL